MARANAFPASLMSSFKAQAAVTFILSFSFTACDWSEFDELEENAPVVALERAPGSSGFGRSLAAGSDDSTGVVLVSGTPSRSPSAAYSLGFNQKPATDAAQEGYCSQSQTLESCYAADKPALFRFVNSRDREDLCFAYAWGRSEGANNDGVLLRCFGDGADITLRAPGTARSRRNDDFDLNEDNQPLWLSSDPGSEPWLLAGLANQNFAWYYLPGSASPAPRNVPVPESIEESFGASTAVLRLEDDETRLLAVSAPDHGQVWLYRATAEEATLHGCLGIRPGFGRTLASGRVDGDDFDDLVVAEDDLVTVFAGEALAELPEAFSETCSLAALPENAIIGSFGCGSRFALSGCSNSDFGAALAVGDVDGDGDGEVVVGAPKMIVNGNESAGAVLVYDVEGNNPHRLGDALYLSSAEQGDLMGTSVVTVGQDESPDVIVAGGPGNSKVAVFYCSALVDADDRQGRCAP